MDDGAPGSYPCRRSYEDRIAWGCAGGARGGRTRTVTDRIRSVVRQPLSYVRGSDRTTVVRQPLSYVRGSDRTTVVRQPLSYVRGSDRTTDRTAAIEPQQSTKTELADILT